MKPEEHIEKALWEDVHYIYNACGACLAANKLRFQRDRLPAAEEALMHILRRAKKMLRDMDAKERRTR